MTQDKAPEWAIREAEALTGKVISYSRQVGDIALALSRVHDEAYERGQESMRERAADLVDSSYHAARARLLAAEAIRSLPIEQEGGE